VATAEYLAMRAYQYSRRLGGRLSGRRDRWRGVRILGYHRLSEANEPLSVSPAAFKRQMEMLLESSVKPISLDRALELLGSEIDDRYVCVTFDDGYVDNIEHGEPVLRALEIPATIFLPTAIIDRRARYFWVDQPPPALTWEQIQRVSQEGLISFQSHGDSHAWLPELSESDVLREFIESKALIERHAGLPVNSIAFPGGLYGAREQRLLRQAGYRAGLTTDHGVNTAVQDLTSLRRTLIYSGDSSSDFAAKLSGLLDGPARMRNLLYKRFGPSRRSPAPRAADSES
jgi:peptidoglycan/xylan/chitin deacetylase (PgdA/CDA1 family)